MLKIIADEALVLPANPPAMNLVRLPAKAIRPEVLTDADGLLVRSVTTVNESLLKKSRVRFVGTATAGLDHIDTECLENRAIAFCAAPGCNAQSVADWVVAAVLCWLQDREKTAGDSAPARLNGYSLGIVGYGHTGKSVYRRLAGLVGECRVFDPFVESPRPVKHLADLAACDILSLHVPLTRCGPNPTEGMIDARFLRARASNSLLLNAARGPVVDQAALKENVARLQAAIDVWTGEPSVDGELLAASFLGTPHIAGHTLEAKARGGAMIWRAMCEYFELPAAANEVETVREPLPASPADELNRMVRRVFDIKAMSERFKSDQAAANDPAGAFNRLRKELGGRREFAAYELEDVMNEEKRGFLRAIGFEITPGLRP